MKLIDILVEELPKRGGWPDYVAAMAQDDDGSVQNYSDTSDIRIDSYHAFGMSRISGSYSIEEGEVSAATDRLTAIITREQYEAALAASKRCDHEWIPSEGRTQSGYLCSKCGNYDGPGYDWIDWPGGECPVPTGTLVDVKWRDGRIDDGIPAKISHDLDSSKRNAISWQHHGNSHDIIAYRLHQPQEAAQPKADEEDDLNECIGQYAAPVWNGEGLPPVGCECEFISNDTSWGSVVVIGMDGDKVVIKPSGDTYYGITPSEKQVFRHIRSEAERKRSMVISQMMNFSAVLSETTAGLIYDAIADGNIPGIKLED